MIRKLLEAVNIPNAAFIGNQKGFDLFDVRTYEAAQQFQTEDGAAAGAAYTQSEDTFNSNINETLKLYFFTREDTNTVVAAVLKGPNTRSTIKFTGFNGNNIDLECNFEFESVSRPANTISSDLKIPLNLIPGISVQDSFFDDGLIIIANQICALLPQLSANEQIDLIVPDFVTRIGADAFNYGLSVGDITIDGSYTREMAPFAMNGVFGNIFVKDFEKPHGWNDAWNGGKENITHFGYSRSEEELAAYNQEREENERAEQERIDREREEAERLEREKAEREARKLRYKEEGKTITIKGTIPGVSEINIPEELNGKPVTKIESYAFYDNDELTRVSIPDTMKLIEQGAFMNCTNLYDYVRIPKDCIVGPNAFRNTPYGFRKR